MPTGTDKRKFLNSETSLKEVNPLREKGRRGHCRLRGAQDLCDTEAV